MSEFTCAKKYLPAGANIWLDKRRECGRKAKFLVDIGGPAKVPMCGIHARSVIKCAKGIEKIEDSK